MVAWDEVKIAKEFVGELITTIDFQYLLYFETQQGYKL